MDKDELIRLGRSLVDNPSKGTLFRGIREKPIEILEAARNSEEIIVLDVTGGDEFIDKRAIRLIMAQAPNVDYAFLSDSYLGGNYYYLSFKAREAQETPTEAGEEANGLENQEAQSGDGEPLPTQDASGEPAAAVEEIEEETLAESDEEADFCDYPEPEDFCLRLHKTATLDDLDKDRLADFFYWAQEEYEEMKKLSKLELAQKLDLVEQDRNNVWRVKNIGVLMFTKDPTDFISSARTLIFHKDTGDIILANLPLRGQAYHILQTFESFLIRHCTAFDPEKGKNRKIFNYPQNVLREIVNNMVIHRDYSRDEENRIYVEKDQIIFENPYDPTIDLNEEDLENGLADRLDPNPVIKNLFSEMRLAHTKGTRGLKRALKSLQSGGAPGLKFELDKVNGVFRVIVPKSGIYIPELSDSPAKWDWGNYPED